MPCQFAYGGTAATPPWEWANAPTRQSGRGISAWANGCPVSFVPINQLAEVPLPALCSAGVCELTDSGSWVSVISSPDGNLNYQDEIISHLAVLAGGCHLRHRGRALANNIASGGSGGGGSGSGSGGGIYNDADVTMLTCTVASNSASGSALDFGCSIYHNGTTLAILGSTIAGNQAAFGGGLFASAAMDCGDTILAYNVAGTGPDCSGTINSSDYNLIQSESGATITGTTTHNHIGQNPLLGTLADNGGLSPTLAPLAGSPVLDQGKNLGAATDQRGAPRPFDFPSIPNAAGGDGSDIGAFESGTPQLAIQKTGSAVVLSWPSYYGGFTLLSVTNVTL